MSEATATVYLCHKCAGLLSPCDNKVFYHCRCISGYIRDWQEPTDIADVRREQTIALQRSLALYARQGRKPDESNVVWAKAQLAKLEAS